MTYYGPDFANLSAGWYWTTEKPRYAGERNQCLEWWNTNCDHIIERYFSIYGIYFTAFERDIKTEIQDHFERKVKFPDYFSYFFVSRILQNAQLKVSYFQDYEEQKEISVACEICGTQQRRLDLHPSLIGRTRNFLPLCSHCWFWLARYTNLENLDVVPGDFYEWLDRLSSVQKCPVCRRKFKWLKCKKTPSIAIPFLPINYIEICPKCINKAVLFGPPVNDLEKELEKIKHISEITGLLPDEGGFMFDKAETLDSAVEIVKIMIGMPPLRDIRKSTGSWFKVLVRSGVLPEGTRKTVFGTMVLAKDGHECHSLAEKTVDDLLYKYGIRHEREPTYPGTNFRADWNIYVQGQEFFIELFGLDGQPEYMKRMREKIALAEELSIKMIYFDRKDMKDLVAAFNREILPFCEKKEFKKIK
jgi:hypothetical protein